MKPSQDSKLTQYLLAVLVRFGHDRGYALVFAVSISVVLSLILASFAIVSRYEALISASSGEANAGFFAAEAGLNLRAGQIRSLFEDFNTPSGTSPDISNGELLCRNGNVGTGDFQCVEYALQDFSVDTGLAFLETINIAIPQGDPFAGLDAQEFRYVASSTSYRLDADRPQAILSMIFRNRRVPMFQFMAFFDKDLEITPGSQLTLNGPVHSNGNVFLNAQGDSLDILGQVTVGSRDGLPADLYRGRKDNGDCRDDSVRIATNPDGDLAFLPCNGLSAFAQTDLGAFNERVQLNVDELDIPSPETFEIGAGNPYWDNADLRLVLNLNTATPSIEGRRVDESTIASISNLLDGGACDSAAVHADETFFNLREDTAIEMLDIDVQALLDCIDGNGVAFGFDLDDETQDGLVFYLSVIGPDSDTLNNYGVRLINGDTLASTNTGAPTLNGLTVITDQAAYIQGDYNSPANADDWVPAAVISDSFNVLSNAWSDFMFDGDGFTEIAGESDPAPGDSSRTELACTGNPNVDPTFTCDFQERYATNTNIQVAVLTGSSTTGNDEGGLNTGGYQGGMHNLPRFHEVWDLSSNTIQPDATLTMQTSFVSLTEPQNVDGLWRQTVSGFRYYQQPIRDWSFDTRFSDPDMLPPMTPSVSYMRQELFSREFER